MRLNAQSIQYKTYKSNMFRPIIKSKTRYDHND